jgi:hypothetical protein
MPTFYLDKRPVAGESFFRQLSEADSETLMAELASAFGGDTEALAAADREVLASLDADSQCTAAGAPGRTC